MGKQIPRAAIQISRAHDVVARAGKVLEGKSRSRLPRGERQPCRTAFERGDTLFQHVIGRVHDPGVDVAQLFQREKIARVFGIAKLKGRRLVDRDRDRAGSGVRTPPGVEKGRFLRGASVMTCADSRLELPRFICLLIEGGRSIDAGPLSVLEFTLIFP